MNDSSVMTEDRVMRLIDHLREMGERECAENFTAHDHHMVLVAANQIYRLRKLIAEKP